MPTDEYLCAIGIDKIEYHAVGTWNGQCFEFYNGPYSATRIFKKADNKLSGNQYQVLKYRKIKR
jgi:hypothetical protein